MTRLQRPNILLILFDSLNPNEIEQNADDLKTLNALRTKSVNFTNATTCSPENGPARASLFTGLDMAAHGVWTDGVTLPKRETPFPKHFTTNGYRTWLIGRRQLAGVSNWTTEHTQQGEYNCIEWAHGPLHRSRQNAYHAWLQKVAPDDYESMFPNQANADETAIPKWQRDAMIALPDGLSFNSWVAKRASEYLGYAPSNAASLGIASFAVGDTLGAPLGETCPEGLAFHALRQADNALKKMMESLPKETVIVATAGRGSTKANGDKRPLSEQALKVPLMIYSPDHSPKTLDDAVSTFDIAPTLYDIAGIQAPQRIQGTSLLSTSPRKWALSRLRNPEQPHQMAFREDQWKLILIDGGFRGESAPAYSLYDLEADPNEINDLARLPAHRDRLEEMIDLMIDAHVALEDRTEPRIAKF